MSLFNKLFGSSEQEESNAAWNALEGIGQLDAIEKESFMHTVIIFKHSTRCFISKSALRQFEGAFNFHGTIVPYFLDLLNYRDVSNEIANRFGVEHQSPQLIVIRNGKAIFHASHENIDAARLEQFA